MSEAFSVLLEHLGLEKTARFWQVLTPAQGDYLNLRQKLFAGKDLTKLTQEAQQFNQR